MSRLDQLAELSSNGYTKSMNKPLIVCVGSAAQDVFLMGKVFTPECEAGICYEHLKLGDKLSVEKMVYASGGNAMNAAVTFARQGIETSFISILGDDPAGHAVLHELDNESVGTRHVIVDKKYTTSYSVILLAPNGERTILNYHGERLSSCPDIVSDRTLRGEWLYISSVGSMELLGQIVKIAKANGMKVAFNPASYEMKHTQASANLFSSIDLLALNKEEASQFVSGDSSEELAIQLSDSVPLVLVSDGPKGSVATDGMTTYSAGIYDNVAVIDRTGAGDAFTSGFIAKIASGEGIEESLIFASANSTSVVQKVGAKAGILHENARLHDMKIKTRKIAN